MLDWLTSDAPDTDAGDLIGRRAAINLLKKWSDGYDYIETETESAIKDFQNLPPAQSERKKGKWVVHNILDYAQRPTGRKVGKCPFCGFLTDEFRTLIECNRELTNFCPNCGARMDERRRDG